MTMTIKTLDDVLPCIDREVGVFFNEFDGYSVIDYGFVSNDTFKNPVHIECRGLKFGADGRLIARPFHKFFNSGERVDPTTIDWSRPFVVLDKLDGSMVHPCLLGDDLVFMTRAGKTRHADLALSYADDTILTLCRDMVAAGVTVMFEFTAPENRIVIAYDKPALTLLAGRENESGRYFTHAELEALAVKYCVALVRSFPSVADVAGFVDEARAQSDIEGYVIAFDDGDRVKLKTDFYTVRHRARSGLKFEKHVLALVAEDGVDDVVPLLPPELSERLLVYADVVTTGLNRLINEVSDFVVEHKDKPRREFALLAQSTLDKRILSVAFAILDGKDARKALKRHLLWAAHRENRIDEIRSLYRMTWDTRDLDFDVG
ncbi:MAG: RNA ligase [Pseudomonadota bacterium]